MNPLATPFNTSIELIVFPVIDIITKIIARYNNGIFTSPKSGNARLESYAPSKIIGIAALNFRSLDSATSRSEGCRDHRLKIRA